MTTVVSLILAFMLTISGNPSNFHNPANHRSPTQPIQLLSTDFIYQGEPSMLVHDQGPPRVERIQYEKNTNSLVLNFNEPIDPASTTDSIEIEYDGNIINGSIEITGDNQITFTPSANLSANMDYIIRVKDIKDAAAKTIEVFSYNFELNQEESLVFSFSILAKNTHSIVGNNSLMHGRDYEPEEGLYYYRNRYYHPELGRFLQQDPNGYEDSLNMYQAFNQNPVNFVDPFGEITYREFLNVKVTDLIVQGYSPDYIENLIDSGTLKRGYLSKIERWNEMYIDYSFEAEEDEEYNPWGRKIALWLQGKASISKEFWSSQDNVLVNTLGASLSDFGGGSGQLFNLGTKSGDAIVQYQRSKDFETFLIMGTTVWGELGEAYLTVYGGHRLYKKIRARYSGTPTNTGGVGKFKNQPGYMQDPISGRWKKIKNETPLSKPLHGNDLRSPGPHDVYAVLDARTGNLLRFGETGRGIMVRIREWRKYFLESHGIDIQLRRLKTVSGKRAAKLLETRYIKTYKKVFKKLPKYQKTLH